MMFRRPQNNSKAAKATPIAAKAAPTPRIGGQNPPVLSIQAKARITRELTQLNTDPPPGIAAYPESCRDMSMIRAEITGADDSPFENGVFHVAIQITPRYPFEPPRCRFITPIYHPNIDAQGRICLDTLKSPPTGSWSPAVSLSSLLLTLRTLMCDPNAEDGLVPEIADLLKRDPQRFRVHAKMITEKYAIPKPELKSKETIDQDSDSDSDSDSEEDSDDDYDEADAEDQPSSTALKRPLPVKQSLPLKDENQCENIPPPTTDDPPRKKSKI